MKQKKTNFYYYGIVSFAVRECVLHRKQVRVTF